MHCKLVVDSFTVLLSDELGLLSLGFWDGYLEFRSDLSSNGVIESV